MSALLNPLFSVGYFGYHLSRFSHYSGLSHPLIEMGMGILPVAVIPFEISKIAHLSCSLLQGKAQNKKAALVKTTLSGVTIAWALSTAFNIGDSLSPKLYSVATVLGVAGAILSSDKIKKIAREKLEPQMEGLSENEKEQLVKWASLLGLTLTPLILLADLPILEPFFFPRINSGVTLLTAPAQLFF